MPVAVTQQPSPGAQAPAPKPTTPETANNISPSYTPGLDVTAMDKSVNPCVDFYAYACGGWQKKNPIPADQPSWSLDSKLQEENRQVLRLILEKAASPDPHRGPIKQQIGNFYASCMDEKAVDATGAGALQGDLNRIAAVHTKGDLADYLAHAHPQDIGIYFGQAPRESAGAVNQIELIPLTAIDIQSLKVPQIVT